MSVGELCNREVIVIESDASDRVCVISPLRMNTAG